MVSFKDARERLEAEISKRKAEREIQQVVKQEQQARIEAARLEGRIKGTETGARRKAEAQAQAPTFSERIRGKVVAGATPSSYRPAAQRPAPARGRRMKRTRPAIAQRLRARRQAVQEVPIQAQQEDIWFRKPSERIELTQPVKKISFTQADAEGKIDLFNNQKKKGIW